MYKSGFALLNGEILHDPGKSLRIPNEKATSLHVEDLDYDIVEDGPSNTESNANPPGRPSPSQPKSGETVILIRNAATKTWQAVLFWLYTGHISFMPSLRRRSSDHSTSWPRPCSSKAVYRIATVLNLEPLQQLAFVAIKQLIRKDNVLDELFTHFAASHKEIMQMEIAVVIQYWTHLRDSHFQRKMEEMAEGEYPFGDIIVAELVKRLVVVDADE